MLAFSCMLAFSLYGLTCAAPPDISYPNDKRLAKICVEFKDQGPQQSSQWFCNEQRVAIETRTNDESNDDNSNKARLRQFFRQPPAQYNSEQWQPTAPQAQQQPPQLSRATPTHQRGGFYLADVERRDAAAARAPAETAAHLVEPTAQSYGKPAAAGGRGRAGAGWQTSVNEANPLVEAVGPLQAAAPKYLLPAAADESYNKPTAGGRGRTDAGWQPGADEANVAIEPLHAAAPKYWSPTAADAPATLRMKPNDADIDDESAWWLEAERMKSPHNACSDCQPKLPPMSPTYYAMQPIVLAMPMPCFTDNEDEQPKRTTNATKDVVLGAAAAGSKSNDNATLIGGGGGGGLLSAIRSMAKKNATTPASAMTFFPLMRRNGGISPPHWRP